jgi:hypothetical protein
MTHDRDGSILIGGGAAVALIADLAYSATRWSGAFPRSFLVSVTALAGVALLSLVVRVIGVIGAGRRALVWNQRVVNVVLILAVAVYINVINSSGGSFLGAILGAVAALAAGFAVGTAVWLVRHRP